MPLSDMAIRALRLRERAYKAYDRDGLFLLVNPSGSKLWRWRYRFDQKEKLMALGEYLIVSLKDARDLHFSARKSTAAYTIRLNSVDQLCVADITYIRLQAEFVYLAVTLDGYSRKVVGWNLDRALIARLAAGAQERDRPTASFAGSSAPLRPWSAVHVARICRASQASWDDSEHEPAGEPLRQRQLRELY